MTEKRYAIVRVDMIERKDGNTFVCPEHFEGINGRWLCSNYHKGKFVAFAQCKNCRYGDTKEQLIRKVAQVIERRFARNYRFGVLVDEIKNGLAKEIVEFLGVE